MEDPEGKDTPPFRTLEQHRIIAVFSALYRVESGASYRQHLPWLPSRIHKDLHGCIPRHGKSDASWSAQADCEHAMFLKKKMVVLLVDYWKLFDSFGPEWVRCFGNALELDHDLAQSTSNPYTTSTDIFKSAAPTDNL